MTRDDRAIDMRNRTLELVNARGGPTPRKSRRTLTGSAAKLGVHRSTLQGAFCRLAEGQLNRYPTTSAASRPSLVFARGNLNAHECTRCPWAASHAR